MVKKATSWHMKMTKKVVCPIKRLMKKKLLREPTNIKVLKDDCEVEQCVG